MKKPKKTKRYCRFCKKHTEQKISLAKQTGRNIAHPMSRWGTSRVRKRGLKRGAGNHGRFSKPAVKDFKRKTKATKKATIMYTCLTCNKSMPQRRGIRTGKMLIEEKKKEES